MTVFWSSNYHYIRSFNQTYVFMKKLFILLFVCALLFSFSSCGSSQESREESIEETQEDAEEAMEDAEEAVEDAAEEIEEAAEEVADSVESAVEEN